MQLPSDSVFFTSSITRLESRRLLYRLHAKGKLNDADLASKLSDLDGALSRATIVACDQSILDRAGVSFVESIGALDAIHLASALQVQEAQRTVVCVLTHSVELAI